MLDIQSICRDAEGLANNMIKKGTPCYALYEGDRQWYRSRITEVLGGDPVKVQYVDYGNEEIVSISLLRVIEGRQLTILRPQAIECCLNGYQNMEPDAERDSLLEELIFDQDFTMKVVEMQGKKALIELIDASNYNVASLLLDKIAVTRSQVSPLLVQAGSKIEHRKYSQQYGSKDQRRTERNKNNYDANDNNENSWRQNNKGFGKSYDRSKRDHDFNDSTDSEKHSVKSFGKNERFNQNNTRNSESGSWKQNGGFNNNQDRSNRDSSRNYWDRREDRKSPRNRDNWNGNKDNDKQSFHSRDNDKDHWTNSNANDKGVWADSKEDDTKLFNKKGQDRWGKSDSNFNKEENWGSSNDNESKKFNLKERDRDSWTSKHNDNKQNFQSQDDGWENTEDKQQKDSWGNIKGRNGRDNFKTNRNRSSEGDDGWNNTENQKSGLKKKPEFRRETSELSSSGSENGLRKTLDKDNRNKPNFVKKFDKSRNFNDSSDRGGSCWNSASSSRIEVPNAAPSTAKYPPLNVDGTESNVIISWFHNPSHFYCQLENTQDEFKKLMGDIQQAYKGRLSSTATVGAPIIGLFPEDNVLYRAEVLEVTGSQFKVYYVDFGNISVINKVWPIEMRFMKLPAQAICCQLHGIQPPGENWPDASSYSIYFDKKQFLCRFGITKNDRTGVQLEYDNEDIASCLLRDGLAAAPKPIDPPELPLLIGQQFRALLTSANSLADFSISLMSGVVVNCCVFNLSTSTETWENSLKEKLDQYLIVYVDNLDEDRLEVTLYDETGTKIKLIDNDQEAYESVDIVCPFLIMYSTLSGEVTHVSGNTVFIQPSECAQLIEYLLNSCFEYYENAPTEPTTLVEGYVYCVKGSDSNWYRGRITKIEEMITVNYFDYGNEEQVNSTAIRELISEFMEIPILCVGITIPDATEELIGQVIYVNLKFTENGLEGTIQEEQISELPAEETQISEVPLKQLEEFEETSEQTIPPSGTLVILSHADSPSDFYLQLADSLETIEALQANLQDQVAGMLDMENPVVGVLCAAPYSLDQQWYRAQVLDADADITTVRFVDYGNTDVLDNHSTRVKTLPPNLLALEVHATRCTLKIKPIDKEWTSAASERFDVLCNVEALAAQFINQDEKTNYIELFSNGTNIGEILIQENLALPDELLIDTSSVGFVSHLNSPSEFWIQLENCVDELEWVAEQLSGAENFTELEDLAPGVLCAALFPDDLMWYRARILSNTVAGIEVLFVDYGNSCTCCSLRELPEDLVMVPPLAQKCSLQKSDNLTVWGPEMVRKFREISADGQTTFNVTKLSTGETAVVKLLLDGVDVTTLLLPKTEDIRVGEFISLNDLVLIKDGEQLPGQFKLQTLPDVMWNEESVKKFQEIYNNGNTVFQAEIVSDDTVILYLGLNDIRVDLNGIKSTPASSPTKVRSDRPHSTEISSNIGLSETCKEKNESFATELNISVNCDGKVTVQDITEENNTEEVSKDNATKQGSSNNYGIYQSPENSFLDIEDADLEHASASGKICQNFKNSISNFENKEATDFPLKEQATSKDSTVTKDNNTEEISKDTAAELDSSNDPDISFPVSQSPENLTLEVNNSAPEHNSGSDDICQNPENSVSNVENKAATDFEVKEQLTIKDLIVIEDNNAEEVSKEIAAEQDNSNNPDISHPASQSIENSTLDVKGSDLKHSSGDICQNSETLILNVENKRTGTTDFGLQKQTANENITVIEDTVSSEKDSNESISVPQDEQTKNTETIDDEIKKQVNLKQQSQDNDNPSTAITFDSEVASEQVAIVASQSDSDSQVGKDEKKVESQSHD